MKLKQITDDTIIYARPDGRHYHLDRNCTMLQSGDFERLGYKTVTVKSIKRRHLIPCLCAYENYSSHKLLRSNVELKQQLTDKETK